MSAMKRIRKNSDFHERYLIGYSLGGIMRLGPLIASLIIFAGIFSGLPVSHAAVSSNVSFQIPTEGDWIISSGESISLEGQSVEIKGNVIIESGGSLTLRAGSTLIINSSYNGEYGIFVDTGATFNVIDSKVTGLERDYRGKIDYDLHQGMNFISIPFERENNSVKEVLQPFEGHYYKAIIYDSSERDDPWKAYVPPNMTDYGNYAEELPFYSWNLTASQNLKEDTQPPSVLFTIPGNDSVSEVDQMVYCIFDESLDTSLVPTIRQTDGILVGDFHFEGWRSTFSNNDTAVWSHVDWFEDDDVTIEIYGYRDTAGNWGNSSTFSFTISSSSDPLISRTSPSEGETDVSPDTEFRVVFDRSMDTALTPNISDLSDNSTWTFLGWASTNVTDDTATWSHNSWQSGSRHIIKVSNYTDADGNSGPDHYVFFTVRDTIDPSVIDSLPYEGSFSVNPLSIVKLIFSETMNASSVPILIQTEGTDPGNWTFLGWNTTYEKDDTAIWSHDAWQDMENISISVSNYSDVSGNTGPIYSWSFKVGDHRLPRIREVYPPDFSSVNPNEPVKIVFDSTMNTREIPDIKDDMGTEYTFSGWEDTYENSDTAVWTHSNWTANTSLTISVSNYSDLSEISPLDGIYLYMKNPFSLNITGTVDAYPSAHFYEGWNAMGYPFLNSVEAASIFSSINGDYDMIKTYNDTGAETYLNSTEMMLPGKGYLIHITDESLWAVSAYSLSELENLFPRFGWAYSNGSSGNIQNSLIAGCGYQSGDMGGLAIHSDLVKVSSTEFRNGYYGMYIKDSSPIISTNTIHNSHYAIVSEDASPILSQNTIFSNSDGGIIVIRGFPIIASNNIYSNIGDGIGLYNSTAILDANTLSGNIRAGIRIVNSSAELKDQIIRNNHEGIFGKNANISLKDSTLGGNYVGLHSSESYINISSNDFSMETYDIMASNGSTGNIIGNTMSSSDRAHISCDNGSAPFIYGNILISGDTGIYVSSSRPDIQNNIIGQNIGSGIQVQNSHEVNITSNTISSNGWAGVYLDSSSANIEKNNIYSNDFGIASFGSSPSIINNTISSNRWYGASFVYSDAFIENTTFIKNQWYGILSSYSTCEIRNSTIRNSTYQLYLTHNSRTDAVNSRINEENVHLDFTSVLYVEYFLNIMVKDSMGNLINGATYSITDRNGVAIDSGASHYGHATVPLIAYVCTSAGVSDTYNPYSITALWGDISKQKYFYLNNTVYVNFSFPSVEYNVDEDSETSAIFETDEWFPQFENVTFEVHSQEGVICYVVNGTVYVHPDKNWNGIATITINAVKNTNSSDNSFNSSVILWQYRFVLNVIPVDDPPSILGEPHVYISGEETVFSVTYQDIENEAPEYVRVVIDGKQHDMYPEDMGDTNYVDGKAYIYKARISQGEHTYYFQISDGVNKVSTEEETTNVQYTLDIVAYAIYFFILMGLLIVVFVAYRIRKLKKSASPEDDSAASPGRTPFLMAGPALDKRMAIRRTDAGFDRPEEEKNPTPHSSIDKITKSEEIPDEDAPSGKDMVLPPVSSSLEEEPSESEPIPAEDAEKEPPKKEPKYGHKRYLELTKKHRKMRVLVEDRDKYRLSPESEEKDIMGQEEDVDDILRSIKGD